MNEPKIQHQVKLKYVSKVSDTSDQNMTICPFCGKSNDQPGATYCSYCGSSLASAQSSSAPIQTPDSSSPSPPPSYNPSYSGTPSGHYDVVIRRTEQLTYAVIIMAVAVLVLLFI